MAPGAPLAQVFLLATGLSCLVVQQSALAAGDQGAQIAASCASCHRLDGRNTGIPSVVGMDETSIVQAMLAYRSGEHGSQIMQVIAAALTTAEIAMVAHYLAAQPPVTASR